MTKAALRKIYKQKRADINSKDKLRLDDLMLLQFQNFDFDGIETVLSYWPMAQEPNTHLYTGYLRYMIPTLQLAYPVVNSNTETMQAVAINEDTIYAPNTYGIMEPKDKSTIINPINVQLILVPLLAYNIKGYRVGYGKGYYDKFIAHCANNVVLMAFSYFEPENLISDINPFDIPLNFCITPHTIYEFE
jgi:5-formyltetrahydrofolate cyclo-ligase